MASVKKIGNESEIDRILNRDFVCPVRSGYVEVGEPRICLPDNFADYEERIRKLEIYDDDVFVTGFPKSGTTWVTELVWLLVNDLDYEQAKKSPVYVRTIQIELMGLFNWEKFRMLMGFDKMDDCGDYPISQDMLLHLEKARKRPRCMKSHLHWDLLPEQIQNGTSKPKIITVVRNPKDVCVSLYYHSQSVEGYAGTFEDFCRLFLHGRVPFTPFWETVLSYWTRRHLPNILFVNYREMKDDLPGVVKKIAAFLGKELTEGQLQALLDHLSLQAMRGNPATNHKEIMNVLKEAGIGQGDNQFIRAGKAGGYTSVMSAEIVKQFDEWTRDNLEGTGLVLE